MEVSGAVRPIYASLGVKRLTFFRAVGNEKEVEYTNVMLLCFGPYQGHGFSQFNKLPLTASYLQNNLILDSHYSYNKTN